MKKVFLLSLGLIMGLGAFAQNRVMKNDVKEGVAYGQKVAVGKEMPTEATSYAPQTSKSVVVNRWQDIDEVDAMLTTYDLQSNGYVANRMYQLPDGSVAVAATMSHEENLTASDRGTGYNFFDGSDWDEQPESRIEPWKTGWPSIARWGDTGEILLAHGNGHMQCFTREVAGEGDWQYRGNLPDYPEGYPYPSNYPTWPRVVTCGEHNNVIIAVATLQQSVSSDETDTRSCFWRSTDAENWTVSYGPLADLDLGYEVGYFSADDYAMAANGNTVALLYSGCLTNSVWMFKSTDCGLTWNATRVWEDPYEGISLSDPDLVYTDTLYRPMNGAIVIDNNGIAHVALNTFEMAHWADTDPGYYSYFYGRAVDGILYWNDTQVAPIQSPDGNPHHAARLWWPAGEGYVHMEADTTRWIGFIPMYYDENGSLIEWVNDKYYTDNYHQKLWGASGHPALSCDPYGNLACAFTSPCTKREDNDLYHRSIYVSYYNVAEGYWHQVEDDLTDDEYNFMYLTAEALFTNSVLNTVNTGEYWFSFQNDDEFGFAWGSEPTQAATSDNYIVVAKVIADPEFLNTTEVEAQDVVSAIYPNPATSYIVVNSAMSANATISFVNLAGQTVKSYNKNLTVGENTINIDLESGVYFCTVNANGFNKTTKVIVK